MDNYYSFQEKAVRVALDADFNVFLYILIILILLLLITITIKMFGIHNTLQQIRDNFMKESPNESTTKEPVRSREGFYINQLVIRLNDEAQMRVQDIKPDGTIVCKKGLSIEEYSPSEIADFEDYWAKKKK